MKFFSKAASFLHKKMRLINKNINQHRILVISVVALLALIGVEINVLSVYTEKELWSYAQEIVTKCSKAPYRPTCYEEEIPKLMKAITMEEAFNVTGAVQQIDTDYKYCHVLGHKLSAYETAKDPNNWQTVVQRCPSGVCSNGCIHGAFQERFRTETLTDAQIDKYKPQFSSVCEGRKGFNPTDLEQASCYHALGHLLMYITDAEIPKSLSLCRELAIKPDHDYSHICYDAVFMQIYQPLEPDDFSLIEGKEVDKVHVKGFCDGYKGEEQGSCWSEAWPLGKEEILKSNGVEKYCSYLSSATERQRCFNAVVYVMTAQFGFDFEKIHSFCGSMKGDNIAQCYSQVASRFIETDYKNAANSVAICNEALPNDPKSKCFNELLKYATYNFHVGSDAFNNYCNAMPSPWKEKCFSSVSRVNYGSKSVAE
jgi:hypothetical protein